MSSATSDSLSKAYRLIEADELAAARAILEPVLAEDPDNADAWWLYAHAVSDTDAARRALDHLLRISPRYPGAVELSNQLEAISRSEAETEPLPATEVEPEPDIIPAPEVEPPVAAVVPPAEELPDLDDELENAGRPSPALRTLGLIAALLVVLAIVAILALQNRGGETPDTVGSVPSPSLEVAVGLMTAEATETPEAVAPVEVTEAASLAEATSEADAGIVSLAATDEAVATEAVRPVVTEPAQATEEAVVAVTETTPLGQEVVLVPAEGDFTPLEDALSGSFTLPDEGIVRTETTLGDTLLVSVCSSAGAEVRNALPQVMDVVASHAAVVAGDADAVGARMVNCASNRPLLIIAVEKNQAVEYAVGNLSAEEFQAQWKPQ